MPQPKIKGEESYDLVNSGGYIIHVSSLSCVMHVMLTSCLNKLFVKSVEIHPKALDHGC